VDKPVEVMERIITGEFINNPAIPDNECISAVVTVSEYAQLAKNEDAQIIPKWVWRLLYAHVFKGRSLMTPEEAAKRFCKGILKAQLRKQSNSCITLGFESSDLYADHPEYKNIKIVAHTRGVKLETPRIENVNSMTYAIYANKNAINYLQCFVSTGTYRALGTEKYTR